jgi:hypothetical protein
MLQQGKKAQQNGHLANRYFRITAERSHFRAICAFSRDREVTSADQLASHANKDERAIDARFLLGKIPVNLKRSDHERIPRVIRPLTEMPQNWFMAQGWLSKLSGDGKLSRRPDSLTSP